MTRARLLDGILDGNQRIPATLIVHRAPSATDAPATAAKIKGRRAGRTPAKAMKTAKGERKKGDAKTPPATRAGSKQARLIEMLKRPKGASIDEIVEALEWQPHTVRGAIAGALKKKHGLDVTSEKSEKRGRVYRIAD
jgi:hypothetical protein